MNRATYSLLTLRPDPERIDVLCVGVVALTDAGDWHVSVLPDESKLQVVARTQPGKLSTLGVNLRTLLSGVPSLAQARQRFSRPGSPLGIHEFEGSFAFTDAQDFARQVSAVMEESVNPAEVVGLKPSSSARGRHQRTKAKLRRQFEQMGILAKTQGEIASHMVVRNFPVSLQHGLNAEFALKNSVMHITETVDFEVAEESVRSKTFEAQAKCLVMRAARETFGADTQCYVVVSGGASAHAARTVDLLSTVGKLVAVENADDMSDYFDRIAHAAKANGELKRLPN